MAKHISQHRVLAEQVFRWHRSERPLGHEVQLLQVLQHRAQPQRLADVGVRLTVKEHAGHAQNSQIGRRSQNAQQVSRLEQVLAFVVLFQEEAKFLQFVQTGFLQRLFGAEKMHGKVGNVKNAETWTHGEDAVQQHGVADRNGQFAQLVSNSAKDLVGQLVEKITLNYQQKVFF